MPQLTREEVARRVRVEGDDDVYLAGALIIITDAAGKMRALLCMVENACIVAEEPEPERPARKRTACRRCSGLGHNIRSCNYLGAEAPKLLMWKRADLARKKARYIHKKEIAHVR